MSDSNKLSVQHLVIGTAGHIDHGKTSLVRALTGVNTDRLQEEKERGISIDLGFAHLPIADGLTLSFVDVPGHENFVKNMVAGAAGVNAVMLVVAADDGVMPQTREHFDICRLLHVEAGLVAVTKCDAVSPDQRDATIAAVRELCRDSFLDGKPVIPVSAKTGDGLDALKTALVNIATQQQARDSIALTRLAIDRSFALKGFGTVVTGTLLQGRLKTGEDVLIHPGGRKARIRALRAAGKEVESAGAGQRVAVNLTGIDHTDIARGMVLTHPVPLMPSALIDVAVEWLDAVEQPLRRQQFVLHAGTAEIPVSLKTLDTSGSFARLWLDRATLLLPDDRFVLRRPSPTRTVGGGIVLDSSPPARLNKKKISSRLRALAAMPWPERLGLLVEEAPAGRRMTDLVRRTGRSIAQLRSDVSKNKSLLWIEESGRVFGSGWLQAQRAQIVNFLSSFHAKHPELSGAPLAQARLQLEPEVAQIVFRGFDAIALRGETVSLASHKPRVSAEQDRALSALEQKFREAAYQPPLLPEVLPSLGVAPAKARAVLESLIKANRLVRVTEDLVFHADVMQHIRRSLALHKGRRFSVPEFKEWMQISRKYAIPLLEYLDRNKVTRRDGDARVVL